MPLKTYLYLLKLQQDKYYVGQADQPQTRYQQHLAGQGAKWTQQYPPQSLLLIKEITIEHISQINQYENWMTLHYMEKYRWQNVRGGHYLETDEQHIRQQLKYNYDTQKNKICYYLPNCPQLFGKSDNWLIYILQYPGHYHIGSTKTLGRSLGKHFQKPNPPIAVIQLIHVSPQEPHYLDIKRKLYKQYQEKYGKNKVTGAQITT
ncbi:hypothetical protein FO440_18275 [Mucilaginibacter corticis]|uniref:GIY-YIG domain-containing protein n=1 Tax=Mucilaginibacter corticis TaxID=2597670 RepID=A0A556MIE6_9SPHI|nr:GIY-YIG nuclease family protein [Mucilaginibacter corticis]TSJ39686.1 hypothetical protein FO440_18275 [Mucilaginibacter corticis]